LIIVAINLVGGFAVGVLQHDLPAAESLHVYSVLTIGDGLIAQIPALLIALSAGLLIARVSPDQLSIEDGSVGREITRQVLSEPKAWLFASGVILIFGFLPGMPITMFAAIALAAGLVGVFQVRGAQKRVVSHLELCETGDENLRAITPNTPLVLRLAPQAKGDPVFEHFTRRCRQIRNRIVSDFGITLPSLTVEYHAGVDADEMQLCVYETPQLRIVLRPGQLAWRLNQLEFENPSPGIVERSQIPKPQLREQGWFWIDATAEGELIDSKLIVRSFESFFDERMQTTFFEHGAQFIGMQEVRAFIAWLDREVPELAKELQRTFPNAKLCYLLQQLAKERVPVRNFRLIGEVLVAGGLQDRDPEVVIDYLRRALRDEILSRFSDNGSVRVCLLHPSLEATLRESLRETPVGSTFDLPPVDLEQLLLHIHSHIYAQGSLVPQGVCVVQQDLRRPLWEAASTLKHFLPVMAFPEMSPSYEVEVVGRVDWQFETAATF
jgi:type III secretion protein V